MLAVVVPGQGSQQPGLLTEWLTSTQNKNLISKYSQISKLDLEKIGTLSSKNEITNTNITQPLLTATSLVSNLNLHFNNLTNVVFAGHSVGEFSASVLAGFITDDQAIKLVSYRGSYMQDCAKAAINTGMAAVLGSNKELIIKELGKYDLYSANINSKNQIVAAGKLESIENLIKNPIQGTKVIKLEVSGAFHTPYMKEAQEKFDVKIKDEVFQTPKFKLLSNVDGVPISDPLELKQRLTTQITNPVRWDLCLEQMVHLQITGFLELAPGGVLSGIAKKELPNVEVMTIKNPTDIPAANLFIEKHAQ